LILLFNHLEPIDNYVSHVFVTLGNSVCCRRSW